MLNRLFLFVVLTLSLFSGPLQALEYTIRDLGTLAHQKSLVSAINNNNVVTGIVQNDNSLQTYIWSLQEGLKFLPPLTSCLPYINNNNHVATTFWHQTTHWFFENNLAKHVYLVHKDLFLEDLGTPPDWPSQSLQKWQTPKVWDDREIAVVGINDRDQILVANACEHAKRTQIALWEKNQFHPIATTVLINAYAINNEGKILGRRWIIEEGNAIPMLGIYDPTKDTFQVIVRDVNLRIYDLNDRDQVIFVKKDLKNNKLEGFLWDAEKGLTSLGSFLPMALNNRDQIIGYMNSEANKPWIPTLWNAGEIINLHQLLDIDNAKSAWANLDELTDINDNGYIIGDGIYDTKTHAFVLVPVNQ
jgi:hypothetical protein